MEETTTLDLNTKCAIASCICSYDEGTSHQDVCITKLENFGNGYKVRCNICGIRTSEKDTVRTAVEMWITMQKALFLTLPQFSPAEIEHYREVERSANTFSENLSDYREAVEEIGAWLTENGNFIEDEDHEELVELERMWAPASELDRLWGILRRISTSAQARADGKLTTPTTKKEK